MRGSVWFLLLVILFLKNKCVKSRDIQTTFQTVADFIKSFVTKSSSAASGIFSTHHGVKDRKKVTSGRKSFKHHAWEDGEDKYTTTEKMNGVTAAYQLTVSEVAQWHGYNIETHIVRTMDGFFLTTQRLTGVSHLRNRTVLLHHGLLGSAMDWIQLAPGECMLPFTLAEAGYDVWFMNARGSIYSRSHATLTLSMPEFWDFSFEEMGLIDIPAVIDYIRKKNDVPIDFVAHSMGSTAFLVYLSSVSEYKKYLRSGVLIAPLAFMRNVTGPLRSVPVDTFKSRIGEYMPHRKVPHKLASAYCKGPIRLCRNPLFFLAGVPTQSSITSRVRDHVPAGGSVNTILHYMQLVKTGMFHSYKNKTHQYNMQSIDVPLAFISSNNDKLAIVKNVQRIYELIKNPIAHYIVRNKNVSHTDLLWHKTASCVVFRKTLEYLVNGHKKHNNTHENDENFKYEYKILNKVEGEDKDDNNNNNDDVEDDSDNERQLITNSANEDDDDDDDLKKDKNANKNDDNNDDGDNDDNNKDHDTDKDEDGDDSSDDEAVEEGENEVTDKAKDTESNENKRLFKVKDVVENKDKGRIKVKIVKGKTEGTYLGESINKDQAYKFIIQIDGDDVIVRKLEDNQDKIEVKGEVKNNYTGINNETSEDKGEDQILSFFNQDKGTNNDKQQSKNEHKCLNATGKENDTCIDDIIDYGHIFYDGPEAYMDFQVT